MQLTAIEAGQFVKELYEINQTMKKCADKTTYILKNKTIITKYKDLAIIKGEVLSSLDDVFKEVSTEIDGQAYFRFYSDNKKEIQSVSIDNGIITVKATNAIFISLPVTNKEYIQKYKELIKESKGKKAIASFDKTDKEILDMVATKKPIKLENKKVNFRFPPAFIFSKPSNPVKVFSVLDFANPKKHKNIQKYLQNVDIEEIEIGESYETLLVHVETSNETGITITSKESSHKIFVYPTSIEEVKLVKWKQPSKYLNLDVLFKIHSK